MGALAIKSSLLGKLGMNLRDDYRHRTKKEVKMARRETAFEV